MCLHAREQNKTSGSWSNTKHHTAHNPNPMGGQPSREAAGGEDPRQQLGEEVDGPVIDVSVSGAPQEATGGGRALHSGTVDHLPVSLLSHTAALIRSRPL